MTDAGTTGAEIRRLVGVYDADGTLRGELTYWVGARLGRAHCALCDITHGSVREKDEWKTCKVGLPVAFDTYHRNDQPDDVRAAVAGTYPAVLADTDRGPILLLGPTELDACQASPERLAEAIEAAVALHRLSWLAPSPRAGT